MVHNIAIIAWRGLMETWHQKKLLVFLVAYPLIFMLLFGSAFGGDNAYVTIDTVIVEPVGGVTDPMVEAFSAQFDDIDAVRAKRVTDSGAAMSEQAARLIDEHDAVLVIFLPESMAPRQGDPVDLPVFYDTLADPNEQSVALGVTNSVVSGFSQSIFLQQLDNAIIEGMLTTNQVDFIKTIASPVSTNVKPADVKGETDLQYIDFIVPGIVSLAILWTGVTGTAEGIVEDRVKGIRRRLLSTPVSRGSLLAGDMISQMVIILFQVTILLLMAVTLYDLHIAGSLWLVYGIIIVGTLAMIGIGLLIATVAKTADESSQLAMLVNFPMMILSGIFFAVSQGWMNTISKIFPLTYINQALRDVMVRGMSLSEVATPLAVAYAFTAAFFFVGMMMLNRGETA
ncbi:MAG TPA: ABC transporter permease [Methanomicrobia archaeon]|nr:ABC transporter permease [Methanomicrobia archaeon]